MKKWKKLLAAMLCLVMVCSNIRITKAEEITEQNHFYLSAVTLAKTLIEPIKVSYTDGQTVKDALKSSGYEFSGIDDGYIHTIEGETGSFSLFMDDEGYDLDRPASEVKVVAFAEGNVYSQEMVNLIIRMGEYNAMTNHVQNYERAAAAYAEALDRLSLADADEAASLLAELDAAIAEYEAILSGELFTVKVNATQGNTACSSPVITFTDGYGNATTIEGSETALVKGEYTFCVSDGGYNRTEGTVTVNGQTQLNVTLPSGEWFGDVQLLRAEKDADGNKIPYDYSQNKVTHTAEYFIDDTATTVGSIYLYVTRGADAPSESALKTIFTGVDGSDKSSSARSWNSQNVALTQAVTAGMEGREFALEARYTGTDGYTMIQSYDLTMTRVPTLSDIVLKDGNGTSLLAGYDSAVTDYTVNTINDALSIAAEPFGTEGYSVSVQAAGKISDNQVNLSDGENTVDVTVSHVNGQSRTYSFKVVKARCATVTMNPPAEVTVEVVNANGSVISPKETNVYELVPGETYTYIGTKDGKYHSMTSFTATNGATIEVADPIAETALKDFVLYDTSSVSTREEVVPDQAFDPSLYAYTYIISDANTSVYAQAAASDGYTVTARYTQQSTNSSYHGVDREVKITKTADASATAQNLTRSIMKSGYGNTITIRASKEENGVAYYQDYTAKINRRLHLETMTVSTAAGNVTLVDENGAMISFDRDILTYYMDLSSGTTQLKVSAHFMNETDTNELCGGYYARIDGTRYDNLAEAVFDLDISKSSETKEIQICHESGDAVPSTYVLQVQKQEPVKVTFATTPQDAIVFVVNEVDGSPVYAVDGSYELMPDVPYTYTVTASGYVSEKVTGYKVSQTESGSLTIPVTLTAAAPNDTLVDMDAQWPSFRDENNNGVVDSETPITAENSVLYWANQIGDGMDSGATGCPIMVDGYLYAYAGKKIVKVDSVTGEIAASGEMYGSSSFAINNPTYGEGMIFVGLANGMIQAFNADTLESLWIYKDDLKGQPNCQITYENGYIYTGFWNGEKQDANYVCLSVTDEDPSQPLEEKTASWVYKQRGGFYWAGAYVSDNFMLVGTDDGEGGYSTGYAHVLSFDPKSGKVLDDIQIPHVGDLRCNITYDAYGTGDYYFTTKGGYFYRISVKEDGTFVDDSLKYIQLTNGTDTASMSTSTPTIYNGRAYVGVCGSGQFAAYSGHNIAVIDLSRMKIAYSVPTQGYPQTSGILTNAYEESTGKVYVYFIDNYTPGKLRVFSDMPGQTKLEEITQENAGGNTYNAGYVLFTPTGSQAQYTICSPIVDEYGTIYFKNDSAQLMALGATIEKIEVTKQPDKRSYEEGDVFDPTGMEVIAAYTNGKTRDITSYVSYSEEPLTTQDTEFAITFEHVMYQDKDGTAGVEYTAPMTFVPLTVSESSDDSVEPPVDPPVDPPVEEQLPYNDVTENDWYHPYVKDVFDKGLMTGLNETTFGSAENLSRAQFAVILYRMEGTPDVTYRNLYPDVPAGQWYTDAIIWASQNSIITGYSHNGLFGTADNITREQMATMLYRYAKYKGYETEQLADLSSYPDHGNVSLFAADGMAWCVKNGIISGDGITGDLMPQGNTVRAVCATMISRFTDAF